MFNMPIFGEWTIIVRVDMCAHLTTLAYFGSHTHEHVQVELVWVVFR